VRKAGGEAKAIQVDVASGAAVEAMVAETLKAYGRLDCAVNNAGIIGARGELHEISEAEWDRVQSVNLRGIFLCMKFEIPVMLKPGPRRDRQHLVDRGAGQRRARRLQREQARGRGADDDRLGAVRGARNPRQRRVSGRYGHADDARGSRR
jgi:NAD(P)-dependent dehydrogenase (short-subunit alcohol dehydrogenase family)